MFSHFMIRINDVEQPLPQIPMKAESRPLPEDIELDYPIDRNTFMDMFNTDTFVRWSDEDGCTQASTSCNQRTAPCPSS